MRRAFVVIALALASASAWLGAGRARADRAPSPPPSTVAATPSNAAASPNPTAARVPSGERLQALLDQSIDGVAAVEAFAPLGEPVRNDPASVAWPEHGIVALLDDKRRIISVVLERHYAGEPPRGVRFGVDEPQLPNDLKLSLLRLRPSPTGKSGVLRHYSGPVTFGNYGMRIEYDRAQRIERIALFRARAPKAVRLDDVTVHDQQKSGQVGSGLGLMVHFRRSADRRPTDVVDATDAKPSKGAKVAHDCKGEHATVDLEIDNRAVALRPEPRNWLGLCGEIDDDLFVPYGRIDLPEGTHAGRLRVRRVGGAGEASAWVPVTVSMPPTRLVRLRVREVEIDRRVFDTRNMAALFSFGLSSIWKRPKLCADPAWIVLAGGSVIYRSKTLGCREKAAWTEASSWIRVPVGESITLQLVDEDLASAEGLGAFSFTPEALAPIFAAKQPLQNRAITRLVLEGEVLDGNAAIPVEPTRQKTKQSAPRGKK